MMHHSSVWCSGAAARVHDVSSERMKVEGVESNGTKALDGYSHTI